MIGSAKAAAPTLVTDFGNGTDVLDIHKLFSGIKGEHAVLVTAVDTAAGTQLDAIVGGHSTEVALLAGSHGLPAADLIAAHQLLV